MHYGAASILRRGRDLSIDTGSIVLVFKDYGLYQDWPLQHSADFKGMSLVCELLTEPQASPVTMEGI